MIDFTPCEINRFRAYGGANGNKINVIYQGNSYMLKFPARPKRNQAAGYTNGCVSEYLACHIFATLGFTAQETLLGTYTDKRGQQKRVVACLDFTDGGKKLIEFAQLKNTCIDSEQSGYGTELSSIMQAIDEQTLLPPQRLRDFFWDMFIVDALLGNFDRHNGNWGLLVDESAQTTEIAPVYDCGSCLYPQLPPERMREILSDDAEIEQRVYVFPTSAIQENGRKIAYFDYISSHKNPDCTAALQRIAPRVDMERIYALIDATPGLSPMQREFYQVMLAERKERILDFSMEQAVRQEAEESAGPALSL